MAACCVSSLTSPHFLFTLCDQYMEHVESEGETEQICELESREPSVMSACSLITYRNVWDLFPPEGRAE